MLLRRGADPHLTGFDRNYSPQQETPTSLAMYNAWAFSSWFRALLGVRTNFYILVKKELQQGSLKRAGWHEESLLSFFQNVLFLNPEQPCSSCERCESQTQGLVELAWCRWLDCIKRVMLHELIRFMKRNADCHT